MKLLRYGEKGQEKPGFLDAQGRIRDLSQLLPDWYGNYLHPDAIAELKKMDVEKFPVIENVQRLGPCIAQTGKFICIGLNYEDHARETGTPIPDEPVVFLKATSAISGPHDPIIIPHQSTKTDWEVELGIIIGRQAKHISEKDAPKIIAGFCVINDVSERHFQKFNTSQWAKGKSCDSFGPIGPWCVTPDQIPDPQSLSLWLEVDNVRHQQGNTRDMIFPINFIVSYLSRYFTLYPGDIISTGTPAGVGFAHKPSAIYLTPGQTVHLSVEGLGEQTHQTIAEVIS
jgi:2-keto-4-pentenoate hydratase/2-oxohepta-3-ene-1,7-dioic acid hydratase in catechol pathway